MPHSKFCNASASANTSRPQPFADESGVRKKPSEERGPKLRMAIRQPHATMTVGVRHDLIQAGAGAVDIELFPGGRRDTAAARTIGPEHHAPKRNLVMRPICPTHSPAAATGEADPEMLYLICSK